MRILHKDIATYIGQSITIKGWVHRIRELGGVSFILVRDRTGIVQIVTDKTDIKPETVVYVEGVVEANEKAPFGAEIHSPHITIVSTPVDELPLSINAPIDNVGLDTILNNRLLSLRVPKIRAVFEVQSVILEAFETYMRTQDFTEIKTSKIINSGTEGGTGLFEIEYFDTKVFLAQSPQLYKQAGVASGLERVFEIGAAYRAEKHETNRHLNEYISLDIEMGFIDEVDSLIDLECELLAYISTMLKEKCQSQFQLWEASIPNPDLFKKIPRVSYDEAKRIASKKLESKVLEIDPQSEKVLSAWAEKECGIAALAITDFPRRKRPFYTMPDESGQKTKSYDFIFNGVEITSGGLRIHMYETLLESIKRFHMNAESLSSYLSIFKYGCPPHGGFAIGLERLTQKFLHLNNVKHASMYPRDRNRTTP